MAKKFQLTGLGKTLAITVVVAVLGAAAYFTGLTKKLGVGSSSNEPDITLCVNTYTGFAPILYLNNGVEPTEDCPFYEKYGMKMRIIIMDDFAAARAALEQGKVNVEYCTLDALPTECGSDGLGDIKYFQLLNFSAGSDCIVSRYKTVKELAGKEVAYAEGTASHTLLLSALEANDMSMKDIKGIKVSSGVEAAEIFKNGNTVSAAVVYSPDDMSCIEAVPGTVVVTSTAIASNLVSDGLIATNKWLTDNEDKAVKLVEGILWANSEVKNNKDAFNKACELFARDFGTDVEYAQASAKTINYATLQDNINWMGLNTTDYNGMTGERIYTKMARVYSNIGLCRNVRPWSKVVDTSIIEKVAENNSLENNQTALGTAEKEFSAPTPEMTTKQEMSNKRVTINFPTNGYILDEEAQNTITRAFVDLAKEYANARIRIEGNTDNTGNYENNVALSKARAQAVADYLYKEHGINKNRMIIVGNGPKHAIEDKVSGSNADYRTTDFQLIAE